MYPYGPPMYPMMYPVQTPGTNSDDVMKKALIKELKRQIRELKGGPPKDKDGKKEPTDLEKYKKEKKEQFERLCDRIFWMLLGAPFVLMGYSAAMKMVGKALGFTN